MSEHPILFSGPMVRAILDGRKTQTRRLAQLAQDPSEGSEDGPPPTRASTGHGWGRARAGDKLWVRETWAGDDCCGYVYRADHPHADLARGDLDDGDQSIRCWRPSIRMPRVASRITLDVADVRAERLQDISDADARAEGLDLAETGKAPLRFAELWDTINGRRAAWSSNPWVWVVSFTRAQP